MSARRSRAIAATLAAVGGLAFAAPSAVLGHTLNATYTSRLPLAVYLAGAAATVALSFVFVLLRDVRAERPTTTDPGKLPPAPIRYVLRAIGLLGWAWIIAQGIAGGSSQAEVDHPVPVGLRLGRRRDACPRSSGRSGSSSTRSRRSTTSVRPSCDRLGIGAWDLAEYPAGLGRWPAAIGFAVVVWLELVLRRRTGGAVHRARRLHRATRSR